jgi:hypothetical protein
MNFITKLFNTPKVDCPRCLGKGEVDWDDIKRLKKELRWNPGKCAYCNGTGKVPKEMLSKVSADNAYLTNNLPEQERKRVINNDPGALQRAQLLEAQMNDLIKQVEYLHFNGNMEASKIAEFYLVPRIQSEVSSNERVELIEYIERIIESRKGKNK